MNSVTYIHLLSLIYIIPLFPIQKNMHIVYSISERTYTKWIGYREFRTRPFGKPKMRQKIIELIINYILQIQKMKFKIEKRNTNFGWLLYSHCSLTPKMLVRFCNVISNFFVFNEKKNLEYTIQLLAK